jgi:hypothetical protein
MAPRRGRLALLVAALGIAGAVSTCGRKTFIRPPELAAPQRIENLSATNTAAGIQLSWARPKTYADGSRMSDLGSFQVERMSGDAGFAPVATVEVTDRERLQQERRYRWVDADTTVGETYAYRVISSTTDGYRSKESNIAVVERALPTPGPAATPTHGK